MYRRILLAYDGSVEGRTALREGALLAKMCGAQTFLLSVIVGSEGVQIGDSAYPGAVARQMEAYRAILDEGADRLRRLGLEPAARELVQGEPVQAIGAFARRVSADLVVVGSRRRGLLARWWSGSTGASLVDQLDCSLLVARQAISDEAFKAELETP